jgi:hypothetical protein
MNDIIIRSDGGPILWRRAFRDRTGISDSAIDNIIKRGALTPIQLGRRIYFEQRQIDEYLARGE